MSDVGTFKTRKSQEKQNFRSETRCGIDFFRSEIAKKNKSSD